METKYNTESEPATMMYYAEEVYYRALQPPCNFCGTPEKVEFRYFNNKYRTKGTRISRFDQPRYWCRSCFEKEFNPFNLTRYNLGDHATCKDDDLEHKNQNKDAVNGRCSSLI